MPQSWPELEGHTFGEVLLSFPDAVPVGILKDNGNVVLNPHDDWRLGTDEQASKMTSCLHHYSSSVFGLT